MILKEIRRDARESLRGNWGKAIGAWVLTSVIPWAIIVFVTPIFGILIGQWFEFTLDFALSLLFTPILTAGMGWLYLGFVDKKKEDFGQYFAGFKNYGRVVATMALVALFVILWAFALGAVMAVFGFILEIINANNNVAVVLISVLLFFIAGFGGLMLIFARYAQVVYIIKDYPQIRPMAAIEESKDIMRGNTWKYILLQLQFMLWYLPGIAAFFTAVGVFIAGIVRMALNYPLLFLNPDSMLSDIQVLTQLGSTIIIALLLILVGGLYWLGISFYVSPYRHAANAVFYRRISNDPTAISASEEEKFVFANNTPPKEAVEDVLVNEKIPTLEVPEE